MTNISIKQAFNRMWQHIVLALGDKANREEVPTVVDSLDSTSTTDALSAAQGKALKKAIDSISTDLGDMGGGGIVVEEDPTVPAWAKEATKPTYTADEVGALSKDTPLFSGDYNDLENAPDISEDNSGDLVIADKDGNIICRSNGDGFETVNLIVQNITINGVTIQEMIKAYVDEAILGGAW